MADIEEEVREKMRRSLTQDFMRMEDDFDDTRAQRKILSSKLMEAAANVALLTNAAEDGTCSTREDTPVALGIINAALKSLEQTEKANAQSITLRLRQNEQQVASAAAAKDRIAIILAATAPGRIEQSFPADEMEAHLADMFDADIKDFETKTNPKDLSD